MTISIFTLAPAGHSTDPLELENSYKIWSTFKRDRNTICVRSNQEHNAAGQTWSVIARRVNGTWRIATGRGFFAQGGRLLARYLIDTGCKVRSAIEAHKGKVVRYRATAKVYSLPSLLNGGQAVVSRDKLADQRAKARKSVDFMAAMRARMDT